MKKYAHIYLRLLNMNASIWLSYRGNFFNSVIASLLWCAFSFISILLLTSDSPDIFGWTRDKLMLLTSMYSVVVGFVHVFITNNMFEMANTIRYGRLDAILMKPMDSQLMISVKEINYPTMPRVLTGCLLVLYFLGKLNTFPTFSEIAIFFVLSFSSVILLYSFWFTVMVLTIYFPELWNLIDLLIHFTDIAKYPGEMYHGLGQFIAFLLPMTLIVSLPAKTVLGILQYNDAVLLVGISFLFFFVSRIAWKTALRHYTSASN